MAAPGSLPLLGHTLFYVLAGARILTADAQENELGDNGHFLSPLFYAAQELSRAVALVSGSLYEALKTVGCCVCLGCFGCYVRKSWHMLDRRFSGWASHLVWLRKSAGRLSGEVTVQAPHVPPACPVDSFAAPTRSVAESMNHFRKIMPDVDWSAWANIEPTFRAIAEWEMSTEHFRAQVSLTLKGWRARNNEGCEGVCGRNGVA